MKKDQIRPRLKGNPEHWLTIINKVKDLGLKNAIETLYGHEFTNDEEILKENEKLAKKHQKQKDLRRIENKAWRENVRFENAIRELHKQMHKRLESTPISVQKKPYKISQRAGAIVVQFSDAHFNELIDVQTNKYDFKIAAKRLQLLASEVKEYGQYKRTNKLVIAFGGDVLNSNRRLDEVLAMATNRSNAALLSVELIAKWLLDLAGHFNITCCAVTGNESRVGQELGFSYDLATDNYDTVIYGMLRILLRKDQRFIFMPMKANEALFEVHGITFLSIHGHQIKQSNVQKSIQEIIGKYSNRGVQVDYVLAGHIHSAYISDYFSRNSSLCGSNAYSEEALNFVSKASQNMHYVEDTGRVHSMKIDLQNVEDIIGYPIDDAIDCYHAKSVDKIRNNVIIHQIVI